MGELGGRSRKRSQKASQFGPKSPPIVLVQRHVTQHVVPVDQKLAHLFQFAPNGGPILLDFPGQVPHKEELTEPSHLFRGPACLIKVGAQTGVNHPVPTGHQGGLGPGFCLQHELLEAFLIIQFDRQEYVLENRQQIIRLGDGSFSSQQQPRGRFATCPDGRCKRRRRNAACLAPDALRQFNKILFFGSDLDQGLTEKRDVWE